jgi:hypothetical protein
MPRISVLKATGLLLESQSDPAPLDYTAADMLTADEAALPDDEIAALATQRMDERNETRRAECLETLRQNAIAAGFRDDDIEVRYCDDTEVAALVAAANEAVKTYVDKRRAAYPSITDQLDAIWKGGTAVDVMRATIAAVKAEFPK